MPAPSGLDAQLGIAEESTYGTAVTPTRFYEIVPPEGLKNKINPVKSKAIRTGTRTQRSDRWRQGTKEVGGPIKVELANKGLGVWLKHMMGTIVTTGPVATLYTHTATPGSLTGKSLTSQVGRPDAAGTVQPFTYEGCKVGSWEISAKVDEVGELQLDLIAEDEKSPVSTPAGLALAAASFPATVALFTFVEGSLTVAGSAFSVKSFSLKGDNGLVRRPFIGTQLTKEPLEARKRTYTGELEAEFNDTVAYGRFIAGTEAALVMTFSVTVASVTFTLTITCNVRFDGETPNVEDEDILKNKVPFECTDTGAGPQTAITIAYVTTDATP